MGSESERIKLWSRQTVGGGGDVSNKTSTFHVLDFALAAAVSYFCTAPTPLPPPFFFFFFFFFFCNKLNKKKNIYPYIFYKRHQPTAGKYYLL